MLNELNVQVRGSWFSFGNELSWILRCDKVIKDIYWDVWVYVYFRLGYSLFMNENVGYKYVGWWCELYMLICAQYVFEMHLWIKLSDYCLWNQENEIYVHTCRNVYVFVLR